MEKLSFTLAIDQKQLTRVAKSPSETLVLGDGIDASYLIEGLIKEIFLLPSVLKTKCKTNHKSLFDTQQQMPLTIYN